MESFWATFKTELIDRRVCVSCAEANSEIFHNPQRLHGALSFNPPVNFENSLSENNNYHPALRLVLIQSRLKPAPSRQCVSLATISPAKPPKGRTICPLTKNRVPSPQ